MHITNLQLAQSTLGWEKLAGKTNLARTDRREGEASRRRREGGEEGPTAGAAVAAGLCGASSGGWRRARARSERRGPEPGGAAPAEVAGMGRHTAGLRSAPLARSTVTGGRRTERRDVCER